MTLRVKLESEIIERCLMALDEIWAKEPIPFEDREEMVRAVIERLKVGVMRTKSSKEEREYWHDITMKLMAGSLEIVYARSDYPEEGKIYITLAKPEEGTNDPDR